MLDDGLVQPPDVADHGGVHVICVLHVAPPWMAMADYASKYSAYRQGPSAVTLGERVTKGILCR